MIRIPTEWENKINGNQTTNQLWYHPENDVRVEQGTGLGKKTCTTVPPFSQKGFENWRFFFYLDQQWGKGIYGSG